MLKKLPLLLAMLFVLSCSTQQDPLARIDHRYAEILADLNAARRDTTRNVHNKDALRRKVAFEQQILAFFNDPAVMSAIEQARKSPEGTLLRHKGESYWRQAVVSRAWTKKEKEQETRLLAILDNISGSQASWGHPDGRTQVPLNGPWLSTSQDADAMPGDLREDLDAEYVDHRMRLVGDDLRDLIQLRNRVAKRAGFETYWHLALFNRGLDQNDVDKLVQELHSVIVPLNRARAQIVELQAQRMGIANDFANNPLLRRAAGLETDNTVAESYFDTDLAESRIRESLSDMGIDLGNLQIYYGPSRYTLPGAYSFPIRPPDLLAMIISVDKRFDTWFYEAMIHESGYIWWWRNLQAQALASPVLWEPPSAYMEGFAQLFERIMYEPAWLKRYIPDIPPQLLQQLSDNRAQQAVRAITESIIETAVERRAYEDPTNWGAVARYCTDMESTYDLHVEPTPTTSDGLPYCEALLHPLIWHYPAYAQNYIFSYITEARLFEALRADLGTPVANGAVGPWLVDNIIQGGASSPFESRLDSVSPDTDRTAALKRYIKPPAPLAPEPPANAPSPAPSPPRKGDNNKLPR